MEVRVLEQGVIYSGQKSYFGYTAWPSIALADNGDLLVVASGMRRRHICPFGKVVLFRSHDEGKHWSAPMAIVDTPGDDRDSGIVNLGNGKYLVTTFDSPLDGCKWYEEPERMDTESIFFRAYVDEIGGMKPYTGSFVYLSDDNAESFRLGAKIPLTAPHGPILTKDGRLVYVGKRDYSEDVEGVRPPDRPVQCMESTDGGNTWTLLGTIPKPDGMDDETEYCEPHVAELTDGTLIAHIRVQSCYDWRKLRKQPVFTVHQSESYDGGHTWTIGHPTTGLPTEGDQTGSPPHIMTLCDGTLISVYGRRIPPYGQRVMISEDNGCTWSIDHTLTDTEPDGDMGYPASVQLPCGDIITIAYGKRNAGELCGLYYTRWRLE